MRSPGHRSGDDDAAPFTLRLPRPVYEALRALAYGLDTTRSTLIIEAVREYVRRRSEAELDGMPDGIAEHLRSAVAQLDR